MSCIDPSQIEALLSEAKVTSMTEIVTFIADNVSKIAMGHIACLEERVLELENPRGMDRIMIEEVKALVEAMLDQRQEGLRRQLQKKYRETICSSFDINEQRSRGSLNEVDLNNMINMQLPFSSQQLKKSSLPQQQKQQQPNSQVAAQLREIQAELQSKPQRRELLELKKTVSLFSKELVGKVTFQEAEKLMLKFQKDIFIKINQDKVSMDELGSKISRTIESSLHDMRGEIGELSKGRAVGAKLQKKVKKYLQEMAFLRSDIEKVSSTLNDHHQQCTVKYKNHLENIESLQSLIEKMAEQREDFLKKAQRSQYKNALLMSRPISTKNGLVTWERELINSEPDNIEFESGKTAVRLVSSGLYEVVCSIFGGRNNQKPPLLMFNSEILGRFQGRNHQSETAARWVFRQWLQVTQSKGTLAVRYEGQESSTCILLQIKRVTY